MPPAPLTAATDEVGLLACLSRSELAARWVEVLKAAHLEELGHGRRRVWDRVGRRDDVRAVMAEFNRRARQLEEERDAYLAAIERFELFAPLFDGYTSDAL